MGAGAIHPGAHIGNWRSEGSRSQRSRLFHCVRKIAELPSPYADGEVLDWHALRHSYCCLLREAGVDVGTAAVLMGHKTLAMTQRVYSRYDRIEKRGAIDALPVFRGAAPCQIRANARPAGRN